MGNNPIRQDNHETEVATDVAARSNNIVQEELFIPLFMTVLSQSFLTLMRCHFMAFPFFTRRHNQEFF